MNSLKHYEQHCKLSSLCIAILPTICSAKTKRLIKKKQTSPVNTYISLDFSIQFYDII